MKIGLVYGNWSSAGHKFNFINNDILKNKRGLTGSEYSCFMIASELVKLGHYVILFAGIESNNDHIKWNGVEIRSINRLSEIDKDHGYDAIYSWNEPDLLRNVHRHTLTMCNMQINSFNHCSNDFDKYIDIFTSPSESHRDIIGSQSNCKDKWVVVPNGCDTSLYDVRKIVEGRVIWASSPDRGLHHLLQIWPHIRRSVPNAHLKIFYKLDPWIEHFINVDTRVDKSYPEFHARASFIKEAIRRFKLAGGCGIEVCDSVSREQMIKEMSEAQVLAYPCDCVMYTEGFSVTLMEACASGTVPVTTTQDALGQIYGKHVPIVQSPVLERLDEYKNLVVKILTDKDERRKYAKSSYELANKYLWSDISLKVSNIIEEACDKKNKR